MIHIFNIIKKHKIFLLGFIIVVFAHLVPFIVFGQDLTIKIHDNLEQPFLKYLVLARSGMAFADQDAIVPQIMGGLPRKSFDVSEFNILLWIFTLFPPFAAYVINNLVVRIVAYMGMFALARRYIFHSSDQKDLWATVLAVAFASIPFWTLGGLTVPGQPLLVFAIANFYYKKHRWYDFAILIFVPLYSSFELSYLFFVALAGLWGMWDTYRNRKVNYTFFSALIFFTFFSLTVQWRLVHSMVLDPSYVSHRVEFDKIALWGTTSITSALFTGRDFFVNGHYHAESVHTFLILPFSLLILNLQVYKKQIDPRFWILFCTIAVTSIFAGIWTWDGVEVLQSKFEILRTFNVTRFYWLHPLMWYTLAALGISYLLQNYNDRKWLGKFVLIICIIHIALNITKTYYLYEGKADDPSFQSYFNTQVFDQISKKIDPNKDTYRVVSIGINPAASIYNDYYTLDGYLGNYPLDYKHEFRKLMEDELEVHDDNRKYFDYFGNRCYYFAHELGRDTIITKSDKRKISDLKFDSTQFKQMGGRYVFSAVEIENYEINNLKYIDLFESADSPFRVYVYEVV